MRYIYLYRVLRNDEDHTKGLKPASPNSTVSLVDHVAMGSRITSRYISSCSNLEAARRFARMGFTSKTIVTIDTEKLEKVPGVVIFDLTDSSVRHLHCGSSSRAMSLADTWDEVVIDGEIPSHCIVGFERYEK